MITRSIPCPLLFLPQGYTYYTKIRQLTVILVNFNLYDPFVCFYAGITINSINVNVYMIFDLHG